MTHDLTRSEGLPEPTSDDDLVAYLDGELSAELSREIERRLAQDADLRQRLQQHQAAWDLLEEIPRPEVSASFTRTTIEMVAVTASDDVNQAERQQRRRRQIAWGAAVATWLLVVASGFMITRFFLSAPNRQLVKDLPILEHLDAYRNVEDVEFLRSLARENLFTAETDDGL
jgi:anti-sigma factor RsiW